MSPRRYRITISGQTFDVEVGELGASPITVTVDGVDYEVELPEGAVRQRLPQPRAQQVAPPPQARPAAPARPTPGAGDGRVVRAMMPGRVLSVSVKPGDAVKRGQALLVIESMKMENTVACPRDGTVVSVLVSAGDTVQHSQTLVELDPS